MNLKSIRKYDIFALSVAFKTVINRFCVSCPNWNESNTSDSMKQLKKKNVNGKFLVNSVKYHKIHQSHLTPFETFTMKILKNTKIKFLYIFISSVYKENSCAYLS